jgi:hypothetical protein
MSRQRIFTKAEIMDAARAAAETGLRARLHPSGEIEFSTEAANRNEQIPTAESALEGWLNGRKARGRA